MEYGLIGGKLGHSYSRPIHELLGGYRYELKELPTEQQAHEFMERRAFKGINVTIPYKQLVIPYCDEVDPAAKAIGAVNTIVNRDGKLYGYNTDYSGFAYLLQRHGVQLSGKTVLILGTGATHRTVGAVCKDQHAAEILTASRTGRDNTLTYAEAMRRDDVQVVLNTTPAGMYPENGTCLLDLAHFPKLEAVADVVYNPLRTALLLQAEALGVPAYCGLEMLVAQAVYAAEKFMDKPFAVGVVPVTHRTMKRQISNVSLIGMPGCGKSSIGAALAQELGKHFVDLDAVIEQRAGRSIPEIFAAEGEAAFRRYESEAVAAVSKENKQVIACGGGVIKTPGNAALLHQNGPVLWVQRPLDGLAITGRPLSAGGQDKLAQMETERRPLYEAAADATVQNTGTLIEAVQRAMTAFEQTLDYKV